VTVRKAAGGWVPQECALPTAEQPLRVAEFDELFASSLVRAERTAPHRLRLVLAGSAEAVARDLAVRETACCSFFEFTFQPVDGGELAMDVTVPDAYAAVLDSVATRAERR